MVIYTSGGLAPTFSVKKSYKQTIQVKSGGDLHSIGHLDRGEHRERQPRCEADLLQACCQTFYGKHSQRLGHESPPFSVFKPYKKINPGGVGRKFVFLSTLMNEGIEKANQDKKQTCSKFVARLSMESIHKTRMP